MGEQSQRWEKGQRKGTWDEGRTMPRGWKAPSTTPRARHHHRRGRQTRQLPEATRTSCGGGDRRVAGQQPPIAPADATARGRAAPAVAEQPPNIVRVRRGGVSWGDHLRREGRSCRHRGAYVLPPTTRSPTVTPRGERGRGASGRAREGVSRHGKRTRNAARMGG